MDLILEIFGDKKPMENKLIDFGFAKGEKGLYYCTDIVNGQFRLNITVCANVIDYNVIDTATGEEYVLAKLPDATGKYVGKIRSEIKEVLSDIYDKCYDKDVFTCAVSRSVIEYVRKKYGGELEFLWKKSPNYAIWRNESNNKWYGILMVIPKSRLGCDSQELIEIIDLKAEPEILPTLIDNKSIFYGYHMNRKYWLTIILDGTVAPERIYKLIDDSYNLNTKD